MMFFRTLLVWLIGVPVTIFLFVIIVISLIFDRSGNTIHLIARLWGRILLVLSNVRVHISGIENLGKDKHQIIASNHRGAFDILVLQAFLPVQFRWVAKKSLFKIPFIGWSMSLAGYIAIERERAGNAYRSIEKAAEQVKDKTSILIFPEGTRSGEEKLLPFKRGGFLLALKSGVPIVPISIKGTESLMKKDSILIRSGDVKIVIGKAIPVSDMDEKKLMEMVRKAIEEGLAA